MSNLKGLDAILKNPIVKAVLMKQLKRLFADNKISVATIAFKNDEIEVIPYFEEVKIMPKKDFDIMLEELTK